MRIVILMILLSGCVGPPPDKVKTTFEGYHSKYCIDGVSYFSSIHNDPLIMLDKDSKIVPCDVTKEK